ncbi:MAG: PP0621 family protein [Polaromonas sp.]|uniref:PP0621 family protein n=1 Tax=Polaromonas sp. TaxID=1869339 RepID=UPI0027304095|nr:PP0621 family protein [Polaromonas sp.]MDP1740418.1 PP0621 family protein [Polaromonas sp.]MDP1954984.1 PP0621 family protein [Polaromonas sp.]MDP3751197.1 PP0621 family protein [Polaromonas sp.]
MKYLIVFAVVLVGIWFWRNNRRAELRDKSAPRPGATALPEPTEIVACAVCAVHLPRAEALPGGQGVYCSDAHRRQAEG